MDKTYCINTDASIDEIEKAQLWCDKNGYVLVFVVI